VLVARHGGGDHRGPVARRANGSRTSRKKSPRQAAAKLLVPNLHLPGPPRLSDLSHEGPRDTLEEGERSHMSPLPL